MPGMNSLQLEQEIGKMVRAMMTRNREIGKDLIGYLKTQLTVEVVAGVLLISIERLMWFDVDSVFWTIEYVIPADVQQEIKRITCVVIYKQLISQGFIPGKDFSVDANGNLLLNDQARTAAFPHDL